MSLRKQTLQYTAAAITIAALVILSSVFYLNPSTGQQGSGSAKLIIQLTDPPEVPKGTSSLNLTYSSISLLAGEPTTTTGVQVTTKSVSVGGSGTVDLLKLQNISKTIASASLPAGSYVYSLSFTVTGIMIDVSGTKSPVTLATGGSTLTVTLSRPAAIEGTYIALLQLNPVVVSTPSGYQLIPSAVALIRGESHGDKGHEDVGSEQQLSQQDNDDLNHAHGNLAATLKALSASGDTTTVTVEVTNSGSDPVDLKAIGIHGSFAVSGQACTPENGESKSVSESTTTTVTTTSTSTGTSQHCENSNEVAFVPSGSSVSGTGCVSMAMNLVTGAHSDQGEHDGRGLTLTKGQCVDLTFTGKMTFGASTLVPNTASGQAYELQVAASGGANVELSCQLPITSTSCSTVQHAQD
jgi:Domain of unknown function (DUF4382)